MLGGKTDPYNTLGVTQTEHARSANMEINMDARRAAYDQDIENLGSSKPDISAMKGEWNNWLRKRVSMYVPAKYDGLGFTRDQLDQLVEVEVEYFYKQFTSEEIAQHFSRVHSDMVKVAIEQLTYERDNPDKADKPKDTGDGCFHDGDENWQLLLDWIICRIGNNINGAFAEKDPVAMALRAISGISVEAIKKDGLLGGENSFLRRLIPTWSDGGGLLGGENSFFRKNLGLPW